MRHWIITIESQSVSLRADCRLRYLPNCKGPQAFEINNHRSCIRSNFFKTITATRPPSSCLETQVSATPRSTRPVTNATRLRTRSTRSATRRAKSTLTRPTTPVSAHYALYPHCLFPPFTQTQAPTCLFTTPTTDKHPTEDERSIANRLAAAHDQNDPSDGSGKKKTAEQKAGELDPTLPAKMHGNEPSRGAKIDKKIDDEEAEIIRRMDESKAAKKGH